MPLPPSRVSSPGSADDDVVAAQPADHVGSAVEEVGPVAAFEAVITGRATQLGSSTTMVPAALSCQPRRFLSHNDDAYTSAQGTTAAPATGPQESPAS